MLLEGMEWIRVAECREQWVTCEDGNVQFYTIVRMMYQIWSYFYVLCSWYRASLEEVNNRTN
jgi:hypothetical protein